MAIKRTAPQAVAQVQTTEGLTYKLPPQPVADSSKPADGGSNHTRSTPNRIPHYVPTLLVSLLILVVILLLIKGSQVLS